MVERRTGGTFSALEFTVNFEVFSSSHFDENGILSFPFFETEFKSKTNFNFENMLSPLRGRGLSLRLSLSSPKPLTSRQK